MKIINYKLNTIITLSVLIFSFSFSFVSASTINKPANYLFLNNGLIGWWTFDGPNMVSNVADSSGQGKHGNLVGQTSTTTALGKIGQALSLDGVNDEVNTGLNFSGLTDFTVSMWLYTDTHGNSRTIWSNDTIASGCGGEGLYLRDSSAIRFRVADVEQTITVPNLTGRWVHVVSTYSASNRSVYFNNASVYSQVGGSATTGDVGFQIGGYRSCASTVNFDGNIDDVRIYNRVLSSGEISNLYNSNTLKLNTTKSPGTLTSGLVGHWTFDGKDMNPNVRDASGLGNHANLSGQPATTTTIGKIGQALTFDGVDDYVVLNSNPISSYPFTLSVWAKAPVAVGQYYALTYSNTASNVIYYSIGMNSNTPYMAARSSAPDESNVGGSTVAAPNTWNHLVAVFNTPTDRKLYMNSALETTDNFNIPFVAGDNIAIGVTNRNSPFGFWPNAIDDARVYNRALSVPEIQMLYSMGK